MVSRAFSYGSSAALVLRSGRRGGPVYACGGARVGGPAGDQRPDPRLGARARRAALPPRSPGGEADRGGAGAVAARTRRARGGGAGPRHDRLAARAAARTTEDRRRRTR